MPFTTSPVVEIKERVEEKTSFFLMKIRKRFLEIIERTQDRYHYLLHAYVSPIYPPERLSATAVCLVNTRAHLWKITWPSSCVPENRSIYTIGPVKGKRLNSISCVNLTPTSTRLRQKQALIPKARALIPLIANSVRSYCRGRHF